MMTSQSLPYRTPVFRTVAERDVRLAATAAVAFHCDVLARDRHPTRRRAARTF